MCVYVCVCVHNMVYDTSTCSGACNMSLHGIECDSDVIRLQLGNVWGI